MRTVAALLAIIGAVFAAPPVNPKNRRFIAIGDWGGQGDSPYYNPPELATAQALATFTKSNPVDFALLLGDNFYPSGISGDAHSARFEGTFEDVFNASTLEGFPWFVTLGNHDYLGNVSAEVAYTALSTRWELPDTYYSEHVQYTGSDGKPFSVHLISIDTVVLAGLVSGEDPTEQAPGPADQELADSQWDWIKSELENSTADFVLVYGHYPVISGCSHGPTAILDLFLQPLLEQYGAHYLSGHDHCQEYAEYKGVSYILSGVGHGCCYTWSNEDKNPAGSIKWHHAAASDEESMANLSDDTIPDAGFASVDLDSTGMIVTYYNGALDKQFTSPNIPPRSPALVEAAKARIA